MTTADFTNAHWDKSTYSVGEGACLEVAFVPGAVGARDSKRDDSPVLQFPPDAWTGFVHGVTSGEFPA